MDPPFVSVILPVRNEGLFIRECLEAVLAQDYPSWKLEILVVDGMSNDGTTEIVSEIAQGRQSVRLLANPGRIVPVGMNLGIRAAQGEVIARVDGHAVIPRGYVRSCVEQLLRNGADCVGGAIDSVGTNITGSAIAAAMSSPFGVGGSGFRVVRQNHSPILVETVPFGAFRRETFARIGLFHEQMVRHQDYELNYRLRKTGGKILLLPWLRVKYYVRSSLRALARQYWQYGIWKGRFLRSHPESVKLRHFVPPLFVATLLACLLASTFSVVAAIAAGSLAVAYLLFLHLVAIWLACRCGWRLAPLLPIVIIIIHSAWGIGVWVGLVRGPVPGKPPAL